MYSLVSHSSSRGDSVKSDMLFETNINWSRRTGHNGVVMVRIGHRSRAPVEVRKGR